MSEYKQNKNKDIEVVISIMYYGLSIFDIYNGIRENSAI